MKKIIYNKTLLILLALIAVFALGFPLSVIGGNKQGKVILNESINLPFEVKDSVKIILLYFGYVGCTTICEPSLREVSSVYDGLYPAQKQYVDFYFIDIAKHSTMAKEFASFFNSDFIGLDLDVKSRAKLMSDLRAYSSDSITGNGDISHTGYLYLIKQTQQDKFKLRTMYVTRPFDPFLIKQDITKELE
jgi:protein SCO1/2